MWPISTIFNTKSIVQESENIFRNLAEQTFGKRAADLYKQVKPMLLKFLKVKQAISYNYVACFSNLDKPEFEILLFSKLWHQIRRWFTFFAGMEFHFIASGYDA